MCSIFRYLFVVLHSLLVIAVAKPPTEPFLRIETGQHLAPITRISTDAAGRWVVTASEDKTARIWNARTGQLLSVLRPPVGADSLGSLYSSALSPDGRSVAVGGFSDFDGNGHLLHLFNRTSGTIPPKSTITGLEAPATQLAWSSNSQYIAVGLREEGLRVFQHNLQFVGADHEFNEAIFGLDFAGDGRIAATSLDGFLRIYAIEDQELTRLARKNLSPGKPYNLAFSPDGQRLAIGYQDQARVDILDSNTLQTVASMTQRGGNLGRVAWSPDGRTIYAAGTHSQHTRFPVLAFPISNPKQVQVIGSLSNTVTSLATLQDGGVLAASAQPEWIRLNPFSTDSTMRNPPANADFRDSSAQFRVSADGASIAFAWNPEVGSLVFDLQRESLAFGQGNAMLHPPLTHPGLNQWKNSNTPMLNGKALRLRPGELARSSAASPNQQYLAIGTDWYLRYYHPSGRPLWEQRIPATAWVVNLTADGRWLVAGLGDGSIRWYQTRDGAERLALYVHPDLTRWITWTPQGYYNTSAGAEPLIGWHLNRAFNQSADFFSAGRFRDQLYRPELVQNILALDVEPDAIASLANLPPLIELQSDNLLETHDDTVVVRYHVRSPPEAPLQSLRVRVNGRLERSIQPSKTRSNRNVDGFEEVAIRVPAKQDAQIVLVAENRHAKSDPITIQVKRPTPVVAASAKAPSSPTTPAWSAPEFDNLVVLLVAVNKYPGDSALQSPVKDVLDIKQFIEQMQQGPASRRKIYKNLRIKTLTDETATRSNIEQGLNWLKTNVGSRDAGVLFLAGHGFTDNTTYSYVPFLPPGKKINDKSEWVDGNLIAQTLQSLKGRPLFFLDTCYSGAFANQAKLSTNTTALINRIDDERGVTIFASSTGKQESGEDDFNGFFTKALLEGLRGEAADKVDGLIYPSSLKRYVTRRVKQLSNNEQTPFISDMGVDEPIAVVVP
jgi:dipeptidyl aminopeptidase/acylaminoacyl peptidase